MPAGTVNKDGVAKRIIAADANVPINVIKPTGFTETGPGIVTHPIGQVEQSIKTPVERMGAAKPWISKVGHAVAAANAHDPPSSKPSMKMGKKQGQSPVGYAGNDQGGYEDAGAAGGYE